MTQFTDSYVAYIGLKSVTLGGKNCVRDSLVNCEQRRGYAISRFQSETEVNNFLQICIDKGLLFADDVKSNAYQEACALSKAGILSGEIKPI
ncbi:MAG: hypothetical protein ACJA04_000598 [Cellvibrionaceae bacterium]|jgi:hypothetical protein